MKQRKSNANSTFNAKQNTYCSLQFCSCHLHYHPFSCFLVQIAIGPHYIKETPRIRYWCFPENQDPSSSGSRDWKCSLATESSCFFHSLAAYHVSEEIATFGMTTTKSGVFLGTNLIKKKKKNIHIEILWCNDVLNTPQRKSFTSAENPQKKPGLWELQFQYKWKWPPHDSTPAKHTGWERPLKLVTFIFRLVGYSSVVIK